MQFGAVRGERLAGQRPGGRRARRARAVSAPSGSAARCRWSVVIVAAVHRGRRCRWPPCPFAGASQGSRPCGTGPAVASAGSGAAGAAVHAGRHRSSPGGTAWRGSARSSCGQRPYRRHGLAADAGQQIAQVVPPTGHVRDDGRQAAAEHQRVLGAEAGGPSPASGPGAGCLRAPAPRWIVGRLVAELGGGLERGCVVDARRTTRPCRRCPGRLRAVGAPPLGAAAPRCGRR